MIDARPSGDREPRAPAVRLSARSLATAFGALGALVAVVTGVVAVLFQVAPGLRPQEPPLRLAAEVSSLVIDGNMTLGQYAARFDDVDAIEDELRQTVGSDFSRARGVVFALRGLVVYVQIRSQGLDDPLLPPDVHLYDAVDGRRLVSEQRGTIVGDTRRSECEPRADDDQCVAAVFKLCDPRQERVRVRVELRDSEGRLMDLDTTDEVRCRV